MIKKVDGMAVKARAIMKLLRWLIVLGSLVLIFTVFVYTPFYAKSVLWLLNGIVDIEVNPVAAQSQQSGQLSFGNNLEPGSPEWVARNAYLLEVNRLLEEGDTQGFMLLQQRYQQLLQMIAEQKHQAVQDIGVFEQSAIHNEATFDFLMHFQQSDASLLQAYQKFLSENNEIVHLGAPSDDMIIKLPASLDAQSRPSHLPHAIVILGGGLMAGQSKGEIVVNAYTQKRLEQAVTIYHLHHLPIVLSGVEAPYMQNWLEQHHVKAEFLENKSMNTCENTRFSSLLLQKQGGAPTVFLVTDRYHMPRSQRLFAMNGISTIPIIAPLPNPLTKWQPSKQNLMHSRRATYEILATLRDIWFGEGNCREIP